MVSREGTRLRDLGEVNCLLWQAPKTTVPHAFWFDPWGKSSEFDDSGNRF
jgi:hypothetical protein